MPPYRHDDDYYKRLADEQAHLEKQAKRLSFLNPLKYIYKLNAAGKKSAIKLRNDSIARETIAQKQAQEQAQAQEQNSGSFGDTVSDAWDKLKNIDGFDAATALAAGAGGYLLYKGAKKLFGKRKKQTSNKQPQTLVVDQYGNPLPAYNTMPLYVSPDQVPYPYPFPMADPYYQLPPHYAAIVNQKIRVP